MLWGTCAERNRALKTSVLATRFSPLFWKHARRLLFWSALSSCSAAAADHKETPRRREAPVPHGPKQKKTHVKLRTLSKLKVILLDLQRWNSQANTVYCGCIPVTPKSPLWPKGSLPVVSLPLFYPLCPPALLTGRTSCPPAPAGRLGSSSPGTLISSQAAGKSGQKNPQNWYKRNNHDWQSRHSPYLHHTALPGDQTPVAGLCFAGAPLTDRRCHKAPVHFLFWWSCVGAGVSVQHLFLIIHDVTAATLENSI